MSTASTQPAMDSMESFAAMFEESISKQEMRHGEIITAEVVAIDDNFVTVNAGLKSESLIPAEEFKNDRGGLEVVVGDFVQVAIESIEDGFGATKLSRDRARRLAAWLDLEAAMEEGRIVKGLVKLHGGDIEFHSRLNEGTRITVRLPIDCEGKRPVVDPIRLVTQRANEFAAATKNLVKKSA